MKSGGFYTNLVSKQQMESTESETPEVPMNQHEAEQAFFPLFLHLRSISMQKKTEIAKPKSKLRDSILKRMSVRLSIIPADIMNKLNIFSSKVRTCKKGTWYNRYVISVACWISSCCFRRILCLKLRLYQGWCQWTRRNGSMLWWERCHRPFLVYKCLVCFNYPIVNIHDRCSDKCISKIFCLLSCSLCPCSVRNCRCFL